MTRAEHLLVLLAEEACEVAHRASKALRFGLDEVQGGQPHSNAERVVSEIFDLITIADMLRECRAIRLPADADVLKAEKRRRVEDAIAYSRACGTIDQEGNS